MAQTADLIEALKLELRKKQVTYQQIAKALDMSEASVKRMFSQQHFTLIRLEAICSLVDWDWVDLSTAAKALQQNISGLSEAQEATIASDIALLITTVAAINGFTYQDILDVYHMPATTCIRKLMQLDQLNVIELLPGNRIKLKIAPNFRWLPNGPIQRYFLEKVTQAFFDSQFTDKQEKLLVINARLSDASHQLLQQKMDKLACEMTQAMRQDAHLPTKAKKANTLVLALRHWQYKAFEQYFDTATDQVSIKSPKGIT